MRQEDGSAPGIPACIGCRAMRQEDGSAPMLMIRAAPGSGQELVRGFVERPSRVIIPACIGCRAMRQEEGCAGGCSERKLELVSGDDYDQLMAAAADCRARVQGLGAVAGELARTEPDRASGRPPTRRCSAPRARRCGTTVPHPAARAIRFRPPGPSPSGAARTAAASTPPRNASGSASGIRPNGSTRPRTKRSACGPRPIKIRTGPGGIAPHVRVHEAAGRALGAELACPAGGGAAARRPAHPAGGRAPAGGVR